MRERLKKYRSFRLFMDICVRCGACADKCHFFIGSGDPKNMPVLRAELMRSVYRRYFTLTGRIFGSLAGGARADRRRAEGVVLLLLPVHRVPPLLGVLPLRHRHGRDHHDGPRTARPCSAATSTGCWSRPPTASAPETTWAFSPTASRTASISPSTKPGRSPGIRDRDADQSQGRGDPLRRCLRPITSARRITYTLLGYLMLFHEIGLDYTVSTYASEGGNFGLFTSHEMMKRLNAKIYAEAKRLGVKWILGGECGHMWRVLHQYMDTMNGPADFLEVPVSPITGHAFENATLHQNGAYLRVHRRPDPQWQAEARSAAATTTGRSPSTIPAIPRAAWDCWKSRATSSTTSATISMRCRRTPSASRPSAAAAARAWARTKTGNAAARRLPAGQCRQVRQGKARRERARLHLRHRQGHPARRCMDYWVGGVEVCRHP